MSGELHPWAAQVNAALAECTRRLAALEARVERLDASYVRHQGQNEDDFRRAGEAVDRVGQDLSRHQDAHWRSGR